MAGRARGRVVPLRADGDDMATAAARALDAVGVYLGRCKLAANTVKAYRRQAAAYTAWLAGDPEAHPDAFADVVGAEAAVTAWRKQLLAASAQPASVNQGLAALTLLYEHGANLRIQVSRVRVPRPGEPDALTKTQQGAVERASVRRGFRGDRDKPWEARVTSSSTAFGESRGNVDHARKARIPGLWSVS